MKYIKGKEVLCECSDPLCPVHKGKECANKAQMELIRIDFEGQPKCYFCKRCAEDALQSGVFS
jgi:hypothetical protein